MERQPDVEVVSGRLQPPQGLVENLVKEGLLRVFSDEPLAARNALVALPEFLEGFLLPTLRELPPFERDFEEFSEGLVPVVDRDKQGEQVVSRLVDVALVLMAYPSEGRQALLFEDPASHLLFLIELVVAAEQRPPFHHPHHPLPFLRDPVYHPLIRFQDLFLTLDFECFECAWFRWVR